MIQPDEFDKRIKKLQSTINKADFDVFVVSNSDSIYYFTGASYKVQERPFFIIVWLEDVPTFLVPKLEESHMEKSNTGRVISYWEFPAPKGKRWQDKIAEILQEANNIGIEDSITYENKKKMEEVLKGQLIATKLVEDQKLVKSPTELEMIRDAARYADQGMELMLKEAYYGVSVLEMFSLSKNIQLDVIKTGIFDPLQSEFLTACWPAPFSAKPHGVPPIDGRLKDGHL